MHHDTFTRLLFKYTTMTMTSGSAPMLMFVEYNNRYRVGFGWTVCTLVFVHVCIPICHRKVYDALYTTMAWDMVLRWCWLNKLNGVILAVDEQEVRWYWFMFEFASAIAWYTMYYHNYILACYITAMTMIRLCADIECIYGTILCWLLTNRTYVGIGACLNLNMPLLCIRCSMSHLQLHTRLLFNCNGNDMRLCAGVDVNSIWYGTVSCWLWTDRQYVGVFTCLNLNVSLLGIRCAKASSYLYARLIYLLQWQ